MSELVSDTRAFLRLFHKSGYKDMHVRQGDYEAFFAEADGAPNPMIVPAPATEVGAPGAVPEVQERTVSAPHIASFVSALPVGSVVGAGEAVARLELLGEEIAVVAEHPGTVSAVLVDAGALVEYSAPLVTLLAA